MYSDDWTQAADDIGEPQPHAATSGGDLFEGDLFGDELIDIYNSAVSPNFQCKLKIEHRQAYICYRRPMVQS
jgi:hypothetical protein